MLIRSVRHGFELSSTLKRNTIIHSNLQALISYSRQFPTPFSSSDILIMWHLGLDLGIIIFSPAKLELEPRP
jgi:hypothetical protein